jgi:hypothetical protein
MKVLFLNHPEPDYMEALICLGLCQTLGPDNVVDYPYKGSYHGELEYYPSFYTPGETSNTKPYEWFDAKLGRRWERDEVIERIGEFDLVVLASPRKKVVENMADLISTVGRQAMKRVVAIDGEDYSDIRWDLITRFAPSVYFKRELLDHEPRNAQILPIRFASSVLPHSSNTKDIDVFFPASNSWPGRVEAWEALRQTFGKGFVGGPGFWLGRDEYLAAAARSKIAVSIRGYGYDTLRYWEIPAFERTLLVSDRSPLVKASHPFEDGRHALYFSSVQELISIVRRALDNDSERERIAKSGNEHLQAYHTPRARAQQLLEDSFR